MIEKWDARFMKMAYDVSQWSKDSTKVGAVIARGKKLISVGYNGFPEGVHDLPERIADRDLKLLLTIHAEENALINAKQDVEGCTMYVVPTLMIPVACPHCAAVLVQNKIKRLVQWHRDDLSERWQKLADVSAMILKEGGVQVDVLERDRIYVT